MKIQVQVTTLYGRQAIYPVCNAAKTLADIAGTRTLTPEVIGLIKRLGYTIEVVQQPVTL